MRSAVITSGEHWITIDGIDYLRGTIETIEKLTYKDGREAVKISGSSVNADVILVYGTTIDGTKVPSQSELVEFIKQYAFKSGGGAPSEGVHSIVAGYNITIDDSDPLNPIISSESSGDLPSGTDRQVVGFDNQGKASAVTLGWKQFSDLPTPPPFANGVVALTAINQDTGSSMAAIIQLAVSGAVANAIPMYDAEGKLPEGSAKIRPSDITSNLGTGSNRMVLFNATTNEFQASVGTFPTPVGGSGVLRTGTGAGRFANAANDDEAVVLSQLNSRIPTPPQTGTFVLRSIDGVVSWVAE